MKRLVIASVAAACVACIPPQTPVVPGQTSSLVAPNQSPPPTTPDATMPPSLPPPPAAAAAIQTNGTYRTGSTFVIAGGSFIGAGIVFVVLGVVLPCKLGDASCPTQTDYQNDKSLGDAFVGTGIGGIIAGVVCLGIGIPLSIIGANQVKRQLGYALLTGPRTIGFRF